MTSEKRLQYKKIYLQYPTYAVIRKFKSTIPIPEISEIKKNLSFVLKFVLILLINVTDANRGVTWENEVIL